MRNKFLGTGEPGYNPARKLRAIGSGLRYAVLSDFSVLYKLALSLPVVVLALWLREWVDAALMIVATGAVLAAELLNTAIEALCDFVETRHNDKIGAIKDVAAAATGVLIAAWVMTIALEVIDLAPRIAAG